MATITSRQHTLVKEYRRVARGDADLALVDGWHLFGEAVRAPVNIESVAVVPAATTPTTDRLLQQARERGARIYSVSSSVLDALSPVRTPSGVAAIVRRRHSTLGQLMLPEPALVVVAADMQDPGNVGAVIRSAEAGGATGVAVAGSSSDPWSWKALRAAMGSTFRMPVISVTDATSLTDELRTAGISVLASVPRDGVPMDGIDMKKPTAILIGGEGPGLAPALIEAASARVSIAMAPLVESLNAAVTAALLVYEARRQRGARA